MSKLSKGLYDLWAQQPSLVFDVVIVGSGYGGSVAAHALSGQGLMVAVLERGKEYLPGDFPSDMGTLPGHVRVASQGKSTVTGNHEGLFDVRTGEDVMALVANGLGGGSLINAGVLLAPPASGLSNQTMAGLVTDLDRHGYFIKARSLLGGGRAGQDNTIRQHPDCAAKPLQKTTAMSDLAKAASLQAKPPPLSIAMAAGSNSAGTRLNACTSCGDCMTGCNVGAKDSLDTNLLRLAHQGGVEIYTGATVHSLRRSEADSKNGPKEPKGVWALRVTHTNPKLQAKEPERLLVFAKRVILAAGALGSTEILLRSRSESLVFSSRLGEKFSCNGDNIAAIAGLPKETKSCADPTDKFVERKVGPTITQSIEVPSQAAGKHFLVQEFAIPGAFRQVLDEVVTTTRFIQKLVTPDGSVHEALPSHHPSAPVPDPLGVSRQLVNKTLIVGIIGHDDAAGALYLPDTRLGNCSQYEQGTLRIAWPDAKHSAWLEESHQFLEKLARPFKGAQVLANPLWKMLPASLASMMGNQGAASRGPVLTVHPLGGCPMGATAADGVVDRHGQVFDACSGPQQTQDPWFGSLLVLDGAIVPCSLGVNPALTIAATAMAAMDHHLGRGPYPLPATASQAPAIPEPPIRACVIPSVAQSNPEPTRIEIEERLAGHVHLNDDVATTDGWVLELTLHYRSVQVSTLLSTFNRCLDADPQHSKLRLYRQSDWNRHALHRQPSQQRTPYVVIEAALEGTLSFLHREPSGPCLRASRAVLGMLNNIGLPMAMKAAWASLKGQPPSPGAWSDAIKMFLSYATRAGEVRRFDYDLVLSAAPTKGAAFCSAVPGIVNPGASEAQKLFTNLANWFNKKRSIKASKRLTYGCRTNPWQQLTELHVQDFPCLNRRQGPSVLVLDPQWFAERGVPLIKVSQQANQMQTWIDLLQFGLLVGRVLTSIHLLTFRAPPAPRTQQPQRLPLPVDGVDGFDVVELAVDEVPVAYAQTGASVAAGAPVRIRLSRYRCSKAQAGAVHKAAKPPLVLIHGYSTSGNTFTHASIPCSAVKHFCQEQKRDVWVLDLRTSAGMPYATLPWSMEQVALVDIPAALLHVRQVTGQRVDVLAHCIGAAMLSMAMLTQAKDVRSGSTNLGVDAWLNTVQLGLLQAFNGGGDWADGHHPTVGRVVLSQKGPLIQYTPRNVFFASMMQMLRRWLPMEGYQFKASIEPTRAENLIDRLLSSTYYPGEPVGVEKNWRPWADLSWVGARHRMDMLYGQTFDAARMAPATLSAIDDLFGPLNMDTLAQTLHFVRAGMITNQSGRGEFVTINRVARMWKGVPTFIMHAEHNRLVDKHTLAVQKRLFSQAGIPVSEYVQLGSGHQDMLIGLEAEHTFREVGKFLDMKDDECMPLMPPQNGQGYSSWVLQFPWIGPRIKSSKSSPTGIEVACMTHPSMGAARLVVCELSAQHAWAIACVHMASTNAVQGGQWTYWTPVTSPNIGCGKRYLPLLVYSSGETASPEASIVSGTAPTTGFNGMAQLLKHAQAWLNREEVRAQVPAFALTGHDLARASSSFCSTQPASTSQLPAIHIAVASCQYPAGIFHADMAQRSLKHMASLAQSTGSADPPLDVVLFLGDQIYADATAGMLDPTRKDELYEYPYDKALRMPAMRELMRQVPVFTLPDDHEIVDNWEKVSQTTQSKRPWQHTLNQQRRDNGMEAWHKYMCMQNPGAVRAMKGKTADFAFMCKGYHFYLLDTRSDRSAREASSAWAGGAHPSIITPAQQLQLMTWFWKHRDAHKFVATPSVLLPRRKDTAHSLLGHLYSDAWDGYPTSLCWLLNFLADNQMHNTVFLSGDEHHSFECDITISKPGYRDVQVKSIHSSGLYAPYPFANGRPSDLVQSETFQCGGLSVKVTTNELSTRNGFVVVTHTPDKTLTHHSNEPLPIIHLHDDETLTHP